MCLEETTNGQNAVFAYHVAQGSGRESETSTQAAFRSARWTGRPLSGWNVCRRSVTAKRGFELPLHYARDYKIPILHQGVD